MQQKQSGFTLIEISIVLVIIGLILGGALKGQELIQTAKVRSTINQLDSVKAAYYAFQDRYRALPGDYSDAIANLPNATNEGVSDGEGDGIIDTNGERGQVWLQLGVAGFLTGNFNGADNGNNWNCPAATCLTNAYSGAMLISFAGEAAGTTGQSHELRSGRRLPVNIVAEIDRKIDDGIPTTGTFQAGQGINLATCVTGTAWNTNTANPQQDCGGVVVGL